MDIVAVLITAFWVMLPAYIPNNAAVLAGGGRPIDGGRTLGGARLLGDGKTWRGTFFGWAAGALVAILLNAGNADVAGALDMSLPEFPLAIIILFPLGAMAGDIGASFLKRRTGRNRGAPFPGVDQLDFVVGSLAFALVADALLVSDSWMRETFTFEVLLVILIITPILHVVTNVAAYYLGLKDEPY